MILPIIHLLQTLRPSPHPSYSPLSSVHLPCPVFLSYLMGVDTVTEGRLTGLLEGLRVKGGREEEVVEEVDWRRTERRSELL